MKMKSWFDNGIILGNKYDEIEFTIQSQNCMFNIIPLFGKEYFHPKIGVKFILLGGKMKKNLPFT